MSAGEVAEGEITEAGGGQDRGGHGGGVGAAEADNAARPPVARDELGRSPGRLRNRAGVKERPDLDGKAVDHPVVGNRELAAAAARGVHGPERAHLRRPALAGRDHPERATTKPATVAVAATGREQHGRQAGNAASQEGSRRDAWLPCPPLPLSRLCSTIMHAAAGNKHPPSSPPPGERPSAPRPPIDSHIQPVCLPLCRGGPCDIGARLGAIALAAGGTRSGWLRVCRGCGAGARGGGSGFGAGQRG